MSRGLWRAATGLTLVTVLTAVAVPRWTALVGGVRGSQASTRPAPCLPGGSVPVLRSPHVSAREAATARYNSVPPTSGPHAAFSITPGRYDDPVPDHLTVHALEHGHVAIQYATSTSPDAVRQLATLALRYARDVILAPYPRLGHGIALTAWGRLDLLDDYDEARITRFIEQLRGRYDHGWQRADPC
jgi:hypothetical protein